MDKRHSVGQGGDLGAHLLVVAADEVEHVPAVHYTQQVEQEERQAVVEALSEAAVFAVSENQCIFSILSYSQKIQSIRY